MECPLCHGFTYMYVFFPNSSLPYTNTYNEYIYPYSDRMLLYAGGSDVRMVYTPALFWLPTGPGISYSTSQRVYALC